MTSERAASEKMCETVEERVTPASEHGAPVPAIVAIFSGTTPLFRAFPLTRGRIAFGREAAGDTPLPDALLSRLHVEVSFDGATWTVRDLESRNGTFVDGQRLSGSMTSRAPGVIRAGGTLLLVERDLRRFGAEGIRVEGGMVAGPALRDALAFVARAAQSSDTLLVTGPSGAGKEHAARTFHAAGPHAAGPFVPVNCAAIPEAVAERLLFGTRRGAYSGADRDAEGFLEAADGGVLFLDEVGELALDVQAKLLRFLETREVMSLGATRARRVEVRVCFATHRDLRLQASADEFRQDLYYRIALLEARLPPLVERKEEIPEIVRAHAASARFPGTVHFSFIEACLLRSWPGNVRELIGAVRQSVHVAHESAQLRAEHLDPRAGVELAMALRPPESPDRAGPPIREEELRGALDVLEKQRIVEALERNGGNQTEAARALGIARRTLIRRMEQFGLARPRMSAT